MQTPPPPLTEPPIGSKFRIAHCAQTPDGTSITVEGWVHQKRSSGRVRFLVLRDGSGWLQGVLANADKGAPVHQAFESLTQETAVRAHGTLRVDQRAPGGFELAIHSLEVLSPSLHYPIGPKEHGVEFLMENRHLWIRSSRQWAILRIRSALSWAVHEFFQARDFVHFDAPILTPSACEGTSTLFSTPYFDQTAYLTQSGQLYGEAGAFAFGQVYVFGPTFRAEKSKTRKHLTEFWMVEPEMAYARLSDVMDLGEALVRHLFAHVRSRCSAELKLLERNLDDSVLGDSVFPRITYDQAVEDLRADGQEFRWGDDFGAPHETALGRIYGRPLFIHHFPASLKAFYFKQEGSSPRAHALGCDLIAPDGYGEIIGGGERETDPHTLQERMTQHHLSQEDYGWYLDLRRYGSVPHAGFGLGLERMIAWITGAEHVRETAAFPRLIHTLRP